jgi:predicted glycosyltransferase
MYYSRLLIADSQSMSAEAAFLGTPFIWCSHFYNKIYQLEELSNTYKLGYAIPLDDHIKFQEILDYELSLNEKKKDTTKLMYEKVDLTVFIFNFIQSLISEK